MYASSEIALCAARNTNVAMAAPTIAAVRGIERDDVPAASRLGADASATPVMCATHSEPGALSPGGVGRHGASCVRAAGGHPVQLHRTVGFDQFESRRGAGVLQTRIIPPLLRDWVDEQVAHVKIASDLAH